MISQWVLPVSVGIVSTVVGLGCIVLTVRIPHSRVGARAPTIPSLTLMTSKPGDHLYDLEPLFLPTKYNTSTLPLPPELGREPGPIAAAFPPKLMISESGGGVTFPEAISVPTKPVEMLSYGETPNPWPEVGRQDVAVPSLAPRVAYIEVMVAKTGQPVFSIEIPKTLELTVPLADWAPLEFLIAVDAAGLVGTPVVTGVTTTEEVESFFRTFIAKTFKLGTRLAPGFYTVRIGP